MCTQYNLLNFIIEVNVHEFIYSITVLDQVHTLQQLFWADTRMPDCDDEFMQRYNYKLYLKWTWKRQHSFDCIQL